MIFIIQLRTNVNFFINFFALFSQYSPRTEDESMSQTPLSTPRTARRGRGGSFSGPGAGPDLATTSEAQVPSSPGLRRRRSRIPSEEDDKLLNFLVAGGHDGSRERNTSLGNIGQCDITILIWSNIGIFSFIKSL